MVIVIFILSLLQQIQSICYGDDGFTFALLIAVMVCLAPGRAKRKRSDYLE